MTLFDQGEFYNGFGNDNAAATAQNPQILPPMDPLLGVPDQIGGTQEVLAFTSVKDFLAANPRLAASGTYAFTGTVTAGDTVSLKVANGVLPGGSVTVSTVAVTGDTLITIAQRLTAALNSNAILQGYGVSANYSAPSAVPTVTLKWPGPVGNLAILTGASHAYAETATIGGSESDDDVLTLNVNAIAALNIATVTATGTPHTGDVLTLTIENSRLANGIKAVSYTVQGGDTLADIATGLRAALVAAASSLAPIGLLSNATGAKVYLSWSAGAGTVYLSQTVVATPGTTVILAAVSGSAASALAPAPLPHETAVIGGAPATGEIVTLTVFAAGMSTQLASYVVQSGDTTSDVADGLVAAINANAVLVAAGFSASNVGTTISIDWGNLVSNVAFKKSVLATPLESLTIAVAPSSVSVSHTAAGSESLTNIATALKNALNANVILQAIGLLATSSGAIVSIFFNGLVQSLTFTRTLSGGASETITLADASGAGSETITPVNPTGGDGPVIPLGNFTFSSDISGDLDNPAAESSGQVYYFLAGKPILGVPINDLEAMVAQALPVM